MCVYLFILVMNVINRYLFVSEYIGMKFPKNTLMPSR